MDSEEKQSRKEPTIQEELDEDEINLIDYFRVISKYRRMILLICGIAVVATGIISLLLPKIYSATASIVPPEEGSASPRLPIELSGGFGSFVRGALGVEIMADRYIGILESRVVADALIERFNLIEVYHAKKRFLARKTLQANTTIKASKEGIVKITVEDRDPNRAAVMANAYVEELDRQNRRLSGSQATAKRISIENRLEEIEEELSNIENIPSREAKIKEKVYETLVIEYELAKIEEAESMPTIQVLDEAVVPEIRCKPKRRQMVMLSAIVALFVALFAAFAREYFARIKEVESNGQAGALFKRGEDSDFHELESRRRIVATQRRKRTEEENSYSEEAETVAKE